MPKINTYKVVMENGTEQIIRTEMRMFDFGNELRTKAKISVENLDGDSVSLKSADVHSIEYYRPVR